MKKVGILLIILGVFGLYFLNFQVPKLIENKARTEYDKYYEQVQNDIECEKIETKAVCYEDFEEIDVSTKKSVKKYSFETNEISLKWDDKRYYDAGVQYKRDNEYDATLYIFRCDVSSIRACESKILVIGDGTTNYENKPFDFDKTVDECLKKFTEEKIKYKSDDYHHSVLSALSDLVSLILIFVLGIGFLFFFVEPKEK